MGKLIVNMLESFAEMAFITQLHIAAAIAALIIGIIQFMGAKGSLSHRILGWSWVLLMAIVAITALGIPRFDPRSYSFIHLLILLIAASLPYATIAIRRKNIRGHRNAMTGIYLGLAGAGMAAALSPGRAINLTMLSD